MKSKIADMDRRFGIPSIAQVVEGNGGLPKVRVSSGEMTGEIYLHGAHVTSWIPPRGKEVFFVSAQSHWEDGRAIRGGVPICFPWFGNKADDPKAPAHGFVRTKEWQLESVTNDGDAVTVSMFTESSEETKKWWPAEFRLDYRVTFGHELTLEVMLTNTGKTPLRFEEALHSYHKVEDIDSIRVRGLDTIHYYDKTDANYEKSQSGEIAIRSETDRIYLNTASAIDICDMSSTRVVRITKENSLTTVVWNPWAEKARLMSDFTDDEWTKMICIETSNVAQFAVDVSPGERHSMKAIVQVFDSV